MTDHVARAEITIAASVNRVWEAVTDPEQISQYMFGTEVVTTWEPGSPIVYRGEWQGKRYEDKGTILEVQPERLLRSTHFSPLSGLDDVPENYHTVTYTLEDDGGGTRLTLTQDNNADAEAAAHSEQNWNTMLESLRALLEGEREG
ncbi:MAG: activator of ATPase 1 family protein [Cryobacterium sp.]|jgi:uncharacterized protein YndB with AHSA1/START domain|nr:activator of ATPase 1 family protein [Cryobacterium sp.]